MEHKARALIQIAGDPGIESARGHHIATMHALLMAQIRDLQP